MIKIINNRKNGSLFHYAHFFCDCLYPEIINNIYTYDKVIRIKNLDQTLGNFVKIYEDVMNIKSEEYSEKEFNKLDIETIILPPKEQYYDIKYINIFRDFIFNRYKINPSKYLENYPKVLLIKRGGRIELIDDPELKHENTNVTTGSERREIDNIEEIEKYLKQKSILLEGIKFEEQIKLFNNAKVIIMAHGAAMSNIIFCKENTKIIEICDRNYSFFNMVAKKLGLHHTKIEENNSKHIIKVLQVSLHI